MVKCELLLEQPEFTFGSAVFEPKLYPTPSGEQAMQRIRAKPGEVEARRNRLNAASFRVRFATLAHASRSPLASELFELTRLARPGKDAAARVILARAFQTIADSLDRARAAPTAAFARSRAAEQLTYVGQAALALEWSNRGPRRLWRGSGRAGTSPSHTWNGEPRSGTVRRRCHRCGSRCSFQSRHRSAILPGR